MNDNPEVQPHRELKGIKMNYRFLIGIGIGAVAGAIMGYIGQCSSGTCPLTSTWWRGAMY
ncbi:MAG: DUF6132 family protein, partial [Limisphaerales bacterium]